MKNDCPFCGQKIKSQYTKDGFLFLVHKRNWLTRKPIAFCRVSTELQEALKEIQELRTKMEADNREPTEAIHQERLEMLQSMLDALKELMNIEVYYDS